MPQSDRLDFLTVEDAAEQLGLSVATVRRRCAAGDWGAQKAGRQWLIPVAALANEKPVRKNAKQGRTDQPIYDVAQAFRYVQSTDMSEAWVPDVLRFRDYIENVDTILHDATIALDNSSYSPAFRVPIPKTLHSNRPGVLLPLADRVAYQAVVGTFAEKINARIPENVFSSRLARDKRFFLEHGPKRFVRFEKAVEKRAKAEHGWVAKTDITSYFDHVIHKILFDELSLLGVTGKPLLDLRKMLSKWALVDGIGLPQGPNASRVLGNFYLIEVDHEMIDAGYEYYRYMDDVRIFASSKTRAVEGLRLFESLCRSRGLTLSAAKTSVLSSEQFTREAVDKETDRAAYLFELGDLPQARNALRTVLRKALSEKGISIRRVRFSMWRLARIRESTVTGQVLKHLEELAPVASVVAAYFRHFISRPTLQIKITEFMTDPARSYSHYLRSWIFATMLECRQVPQDWRKIADLQTKDKNSPSYLRAIAACVVAKCRVPRDLAWIKSELATEHDPVMIRGYLVALTYGQALDKATTNSINLDSKLAYTVAWLRQRKNLPSLVYNDRVIEI
ncbi:reverse transcriptase domain-containing protein [Amycolatopsis sp. NPDC102389]|uniref:reverse transcriptase domain-containing protein n=1 Tax=Amycolatopsis sp. NPDC102389 TaxID=3363941 RepID=UPI00381A70EA